MKTRLLFIACVTIIASALLTAMPVSAESIQSETIAPSVLQQGGSSNDEWERLWQQIKNWLEQLAVVFAQAPLIGTFIGDILKSIGGANWWCVGAIIVLLILGGLSSNNR